MTKQLNILLQRITGFRLKYYGKYTKTKTWAELGCHGFNWGNSLIAKAYLDPDCGNIEPGCGNMLIAKAYFDDDCGKIEPGCGNMLIAKAYLEQ